MLKLLPIEQKLVFGGRCWERNRLSAIMAHPTSLPWFINNFITLFITFDYAVTAYDSWKTSAFIDVFDDVICPEFIDCKQNNTIDVLVETLLNNQYIIAAWDRYYVPNSNDYLKSHMFHEGLIYGVDTEKKIFYFLDRDINGKDFGISTIDYETFLNAHLNGLKIMTQRAPQYWYYLVGIPLAKFSVNQNEVKINLKRMHYDFYIQSVGYEYIDGYHPDGNPKIYRGGTKILNAYDDLLNWIEHNPDYFKTNTLALWSFRYLIDNKKSHYLRFQYLFDKGLVKVDEEIFKIIDDLVKMIDKFFKFLTKYSFNHSIETLTKCRDLLPLIKEQDKLMYSKAISIIFDTIKDEFSHDVIDKVNNEISELASSSK